MLFSKYNPHKRLVYAYAIIFVSGLLIIGPTWPWHAFIILPALVYRTAAALKYERAQRELARLMWEGET
mgnify:CR=1 FL=1